MIKCSAIIMCGLLALASTPVLADEADVVNVAVTRVDADVYRFAVTVRHADTGWDHYADRWEVLDEEGNNLGTRTLMHPHVGEQPFTRSMTLSIPMRVKKVTVRAHDKVDGYGGAEMVVTLPQ